MIIKLARMSSWLFGGGGAMAQDSSTFSYTAATLSLTALLFGYYYYTNVYTYFRKRGLKGPTPYPLIGNIATLLLSDRWVLEREWTERYGKFYGIFLGTEPRFVVNDPEVLRQLCIKDFAAMPNHEADALLNNYQKDTIFFAQDDHWKRLRALQSPTFTSGKIKRMYKLLDRCADDLVLCFSEQLTQGDKQLDKTVVNLKKIYSLYTMDAISSAAYSIKLDRKGGSSLESTSSRDDFVAVAMRLFELNIPRLLLRVILPKWFLEAFNMRMLPLSYFTTLDDRLRPIVNRRRKSGKKCDDYLQILVDASLDDRVELNDMDEKENHHAGLTKDMLQADQTMMINQIDNSSSNGHSGQSASNGSTAGPSVLPAAKIKLTDHEIISSAMFLLIVGLETTATLLTHCTYALAFHLDIQERLYETVKAIAELNSQTGEYSFDYDQLTSSEYLDAVVSESLRALSPVIQLDRLVSQDCYIEKYDVTLKKGDKLLLAFYSIMNNPEFWPEPLKFDPERFIGDNKQKIVPGSYCPFGLGPRHCLGMRFSLTETKLALAKVLMKFKFMPKPGLAYPPKGSLSLGLSNCKSPLVELVPRV
jgi:cytochrome P450